MQRETVSFRQQLQSWLQSAADSRSWQQRPPSMCASRMHDMQVYGSPHPICAPRWHGVYAIRKTITVAACKAGTPAPGNDTIQHTYSSEYRGVSWVADRGQYLVYIRNAGKQHHIGYYPDEISAATAYDLAMLKFQLEGMLDRVSILNFPAAQYTEAEVSSVHIPSLHSKVPTSNYHGVTWLRRDGKWRAQITHSGSTHYLGCYESEVMAAKAYDKGIKQCYNYNNRQGILRKQRKLNFPDTRKQGVSTAQATHTGKSKFFGVTFHKRQSRWSAQLQHNNKRHHLGYYDVEEDAAKAYDVAVLRLIAEGRLPGDVRPVNFTPSSYSKEDIMSARMPSDTARQVSSQYHGVCWDKNKQKWRAQISRKGTQVHMGYYDDEKDAATAYDKAVLQAVAEGTVKNSRKLNFLKPEDVAAKQA